ncbi:coiled-coil domain-containing protein [Pseudomonas bohemica]|uniref:hypothetical protein n=1 Tax=Pseudomonas bohemica TaxID=2044872 RepID=UPI000DA5FD50|nr:hypothetical protein [Pseudomonas bohemica]
MPTDTQLSVLPAKEVALTVFSTPNGLDPYLQSVRDEIDKFNASAPDVKTKKGQDAYRSIAYSLAGSKSKLDVLGKELVTELKALPKKIDDERRRVKELLSTWQEEVRKPLTDWEEAEKARKQGHQASIDWLINRDDGLSDLSSAQIAHRIDEAESFVIDKHLEEFEADAARAKDAVLTKLRPAFAARQTHEAELAEIARFNAEKAERERKEYEAEIARAAAERARIEAEQRAQAEHEAAIKREADAKAAAERRELELKLQAEQAERQAAQAEADRIAAEQRAEQERIAAEQRQAEAVERARLAEIARANAAADEIIRQQEAREADKAHIKSVCLKAQQAMVANGIDEACAKAVIILIHQKKIPAIQITY